MPLSSPAERLDLAVTALLNRGASPHAELVEVAALVNAALPPLPPSARFERRLARRLSEARVGDVLRHRVAAARRAVTPTRLIAAGAVSSAAVGVTALAVWAGGRRTAGGHR